MIANDIGKPIRSGKSGGRGGSAGPVRFVQQTPMARIFLCHASEDKPQILQDDTDMQQMLTAHRALLQRWRGTQETVTPIDGVGHAETPQPFGMQGILRQIAEAEQANDLPMCIQLCRQAFTFINREHAAPLWAALHSTLGKSLAENSEGERADNLEQALQHYHQALEVYTPQSFPEDWADAQNNLALIYYHRIRGERADNLERAIYHYRQALEVFTSQSFLEDWGVAQNNLALIYYHRIRGERADNLEQALQHYHQAIEVYTHQAFPEKWATIQSLLAITYAERIRGERADNLERAIHHGHRAEEVQTRQTFPVDWAAIQNNLGHVYIERIRGERADNLERAIHHCHQALEVYTNEALPERWAGTQSNLANAYLHRPLGERVENLELAIHHGNQALEVLSREASPVEWGRVQTNLGRAYIERIRGERTENVKHAIHHCHQALEVFTRPTFSYEWASTQMNLGMAYSPSRNNYRPNWGEWAENTELSIFHYHQALEVFSRSAFPEHWAENHHNLGAAYCHRVRGERVENLERAIYHCFQALNVFTSHAFPEKWASTKNHLGNAYRCRIRGKRSENLKHAIHYFHQALEVYTLNRSPAVHRMIQNNLGSLYFNEADWEQAHLAYTAATNAGSDLLRAAYTEAGRQAEVAEDAHFCSNHALCLLQLGQPIEALLRLEQGKTRLLAEALALDDNNLTTLTAEQRQSIQAGWHVVRDLEAEYRLLHNTPARRSDRELGEALRQARANLNRLIDTIRSVQPEFLPSGLNLPDLLAIIPSGGALVVPLITARGSAVFILPHGTTTVTEDHVILLEAFTDEDVRTYLFGPADAAEMSGWLGAYSNQHVNPNGWYETIESTGRTLWDALLGPIHTYLDVLGLDEGAPVFLMPQGELGLLPLHAAWREVGEEKRAFLDDYTVSYVPSGSIFSISQRRLQESHRQHRSLLAVVNPTDDLAFAPIEGEMVAALFDPAERRTLVGANATPEAVVQAGPGRTYLHFSSHGFYNWQNPLHSGLLLAGHIPFTLADIISQLDLRTARLATLSACETGLTDIRQSPNEYLGLPAGFLQAGAPGVVSTLWAVNDHATSLLMERFYYLHLHEDMPPSQALRRAQRWLRDTTHEELFAGNRFELTSPPEALAVQTAPVQGGTPDDRPYAHPWFWAAFTFTGV